MCLASTTVPLLAGSQHDCSWAGGTCAEPSLMSAREEIVLHNLHGGEEGRAQGELSDSWKTAGGMLL